MGAQENQNLVHTRHLQSGLLSGRRTAGEFTNVKPTGRTGVRSSAGRATERPHSTGWVPPRGSLAQYSSYEAVSSLVSQIKVTLQNEGVSSNVQEQVSQVLSKIEASSRNQQPKQVVADDAPKQSQARASDHSQPRRRTRENEKMELAKSIMKKLYYKCVELEKELKLLRSSQTAASLTVAQSPDRSTQKKGDSFGKGMQEGHEKEASRRREPHAAIKTGSEPQWDKYGVKASQPRQTPTSTPSYSQALLEQIKDRDTTIQRLEGALQATIQRATTAEAEFANLQRSSHSGCLTAQSQISFRKLQQDNNLLRQKLQQAKRDYTRLLDHQLSTVQSSSNKALRSVAAGLNLALQKQLDVERRDREESEALASAAMLQLERGGQDMYVQHEQLMAKVRELSDELEQRDGLDVQIEAQMCSLLGQLGAREEEQHAGETKSGCSPKQSGLSRATIF